MSEPRRWFRSQAIGRVRRSDHAEPDQFLDPSAPSVIEIDPRWAAGLAGIEEFSHLVVLFYLDRMQRRRTVGQPMHPDGRDEIGPVGFFATRTPKRPNPIGICCPRLIRRDGNTLHVTGLDAWDETPVLDIKGYYPRDEQRPYATVPEWLTTLWQSHDLERLPADRSPEYEPGAPQPGSVIAEQETERGLVTFRYPLPGDAATAMNYINTISTERTFILFQGRQLSLEEEQAWLDDRLRQLAAGKAVNIFVMHGEQMIGSAEIALNDGVLAHVGGLGISLADGWREIGLGTVLMRLLIEQAEKHLTGLRMIQLDVFGNNERGKRLYQKIGFTEYARLPNAVLHRDTYVDLISMYRPIAIQGPD